jgi:hypothetical protein
MHKHTLRAGKDNLGVFATFRNWSDGAPRGSIGSLNLLEFACPCYPKGRTYKWKLTKCRRLKTAVKGSSSLPIKISNSYY